MSDIISCPSCQRKLQVPETLVGQDVQCPGCGATFVARIGKQSFPPSGPQRAAGGWEAENRPDVGRPLHGDRPYDDDDYIPRRRDLVPHRGGLILTLGVLGLIFLLPGPFAWIMGNGDMAEINAGRMDPEGEGLTQAGRICGIIGTLEFSLMVLCCCGSILLEGLGR